MQPETPPLQPEARCATHEAQPAVGVCTRCGGFVCATCREGDVALCPACLLRSAEVQPLSGPDTLGWTLVALPAMVGVIGLLAYGSWLAPLSWAVLVVTVVIMGVDATRAKQPTGMHVVLAIFVWLVGFPVYMHRRSKWGRGKLLLPALGAMGLMFTGLVFHPLEPQNRAQVNCQMTGKTLGEGYSCVITRTQGKQAVKACWTVVVDCGADAVGRAHTCGVAPAGATMGVKVPFSAFAALDGCRSVQQTRLEDLKLTVEE